MSKLTGCEMTTMAVVLQSYLERIKKFVKEVRSELKKVTWPTKKELGAHSVVVFVTVVFVAILIWMLDGGFNVVMRFFFY